MQFLNNGQILMTCLVKNMIYISRCLAKSILVLINTASYM